jgi:parallel beta-helix repeat protein
VRLPATGKTPVEAKSPKRGGARRPMAAVLLALGLGLGMGLVPVGAVQADAEPTPPAAGKPPAISVVAPADAQRQAALVDQEDQRIMQTRAVLTAILQVGGQEAVKWKQPQIFGSAHGKTLVLPQRNDDVAYTIADLVKYGGKYVQRLPDGSYLLSIHIFVASGAKLTLQSTNRPLVIRMGSVPGSFSSIVSFGGSLSITGSAQYPVRIFSWNALTRQRDAQVADGRAYIRAVGGEFRMKYAQIYDLGFWGGRTGGIALTGTDRPASATKHLNKAQRHQAKQKRLAKKPTATTPGGGPGDLEISPAGPGGTASHVPATNLVTGSIEHSRIVGDAYGIFVSGSNQTQIISNRIENSLVVGVLMHRYAKNATIQNTTVVGSRGDGFVLSRATEKVRITGCLAERNGGNGFTLNGSPLAAGPSASGESLASFGDSSVNNSTARNNGHYGIELFGGNKLAVQTTKVIGGDMGIVVRDGATGVQISGNQLTGQARQGISLRDGVTDAQVAGNSVTGAPTGIYLRNASGKLVGNVVQRATVHGIALRGNTGGTEVSSNTLRGFGTSPVSTGSSHGSLTRKDNNTDGWHDTSSLMTRALRYAKPMNIIWACVILIVIFSMLRSGTGLRKIRRGAHPYARQRALVERPAPALREHLIRTAQPETPPNGTADRVKVPGPRPARVDGVHPDFWSARR